MMMVTRLGLVMFASGSVKIRNNLQAELIVYVENTDTGTGQEPVICIMICRIIQGIVMGSGAVSGTWNFVFLKSKIA
jgi:hypothetical protein